MSAQLTRSSALRLRRAERAGHFFSEGNYDILGSKTDGYKHRRLVDEAVVVERQDRHHRLFVDGGISDGRRGARTSRLRGE